MNNIIDYLRIFYQSTFLPVRYYQDGQCLLVLPELSQEFDLAEIYRTPLLSRNEAIDYILSDEFLHFGIVRNFETNEYIIAGPVTSVPIRPQALSHILSESSISINYKEQVWNHLQMIPQFSFNQFINYLALLYDKMTNNLVDPQTNFLKLHQDSLKRIREKNSENLYQAREDEFFHNTYQFEQELCHYVENGDVEAVKKMLLFNQDFQVGTIGENSLRQEQNIFITLITLLTRYSIAGGLDIETAYQLSDTYIQESEKAQAPEMIDYLSTAATIDFTQRVAACKVPRGMSPDIFKCIQYISTHVNQPVSVIDVAKAAGKSRSYISQQFKRELGFNLSDFIMRRKLEEGKSLLAYTDKSISEISEYLCFSSQSYFQNVFKKHYGITPYEYRKSNRHQ